MSLKGLELIIEQGQQAEPAQSAPEPVTAAPSPVVQERKPAEKKPVKPKWLKMWCGWLWRSAPCSFVELPFSTGVISVLLIMLILGLGLVTAGKLQHVTLLVVDVITITLVLLLRLFILIQWQGCWMMDFFVSLVSSKPSFVSFVNVGKSPSRFLLLESNPLSCYYIHCTWTIS